MVKDYFDFYSWDGEFYDEVKRRVEAIMPREKRRYDPRMYFKSVFCVICFLVSLYMYIFWNTWWSAVLLACTSGQVGVNIMHDGNHMAYSEKKWLN